MGVEEDWLVLVDGHRGSTTLTGLWAILFAFALFLATVLISQRRFQEVRERTQIYLCFQYLIVETKRHIRFISRLNKSILSSHSTSLIPLPGMAALGENIRRALKALQTMNYVSYVKKVLANDYCLWTQGTSFLQNVPYRTRGKGLLARRGDGTTVVRRERWKVFVKRGPITLEATWNLNSSLTSKPQLVTRELSTGGRFWNPSFGVL